MVSAVLLEQIPWAGIQWLEQTVEVVLGIMAIFVVTVVVEKYIRVGRVRRISGVYAPQVASAFRANNWDKAIALSEVYADRAHLARVVYSGLKEREKLNERRLAEPLIARHIN